MKMKLGMIVYLHETFHLTKGLGLTQRVLEGVTKKPPKKTPKLGFLAPFLGIFRTTSKTVTYVILCLALHHWRKFCTNPTWFRVIIHEKPPKSSPKSPFLLVQETSKIYNLRTTNAMKMKLGTIVDLHEIFHLTKDLHVNHKAWQGVAKKPLKKVLKLFRSTCSNFMWYIKTRNICESLLCTGSLVKIFYKWDAIWGCNLRKTIQKQPKIPLFSATTNFESL